MPIAGEILRSAAIFAPFRFLRHYFSQRDALPPLFSFRRATPAATICHFDDYYAD